MRFQQVPNLPTLDDFELPSRICIINVPRKYERK